MMLFLFLFFLLGVTLWAVGSVYHDLKIRDQMPPAPPTPPIPQNHLWPPPPQMREE